MHLRPNLLLVMTLFLSLTCCRTLGSQGISAHNLGNGLYWFGYDMNSRGALLINRGNGKFYMCAEPAPDSALNMVASSLRELTLQGDKSGGKGQGKMEDTVNMTVQMANRTQTILFLREAMYRLCEQQANGMLDPNAVVTLYDKVVETSITLAEAQVLEALAKLEKKEVAQELMEMFIRGQLDKKKLEQEERLRQAENERFKTSLKELRDRKGL